MDVDRIRVAVQGPQGAYASALVAALFSMYLKKSWDLWIPTHLGDKRRNELLREQCSTIQNAKVLTVFSLVTMIFCLQMGWLNSHDWRVIGLALGLMAIIPICSVVAANYARGGNGIKEGLVAFAISEKTPTGIFMGVICIFLACGAASAVSWFFWR